MNIVNIMDDQSYNDPWLSVDDGYREFTRRFDSFLFASQARGDCSATAACRRVFDERTLTVETSIMMRELMSSKCVKDLCAQLARKQNTSLLYRYMCSAARVRMDSTFSFVMPQQTDLTSCLRLLTPVSLSNTIDHPEKNPTTPFWTDKQHIEEAAAAAAAEAAANYSLHGDSLWLEFLALQERIREVSSSSISTDGSDNSIVVKEIFENDYENDECDDETKSQNFFTALRTRLHCEYNVRECLTGMIIQAYAIRRLNEERSELTARLNDLDRQIAHLRVLRDGMLGRIGRMKTALLDEEREVAAVQEREKTLRDAHSSLTVQLQLAQDHVNHVARLAMNEIVDRMQTIFEQVDSVRRTELASAQESLRNLNAEKIALMSAICRVLRQVERVHDPSSSRDRCRYDFVLENEEYIRAIAARCQTSGALVLASRDPGELMAIVTQCDVFQRSIMTNHAAFVKAYDDLRAEREKYELYKRARDLRMKSMRKYGSLLYEYCKWRECAMNLTHGVLLPLDLIKGPYVVSSKSPFYVKPTHRASRLHLVDLRADESEKFITSVMNQQKQQVNWSDNRDANSQSDGNRNECSLIASLINSILSLRDSNYKTWTASPTAAIECRASDLTNDMKSRLSDAFSFEDESSYITITTTTVNTKIAATECAAKHSRDRVIRWPQISKRPLYEMIGLKFAVLCALTPLPTEVPSYQHITN